MPKWISSPRDLWTGLIYVGLGAGAFWIALDYPIGTVGRMGPGYFPRVLALCLVAIGLIALVRAFVIDSEAVSHLAWKPLLLICGAIVLFGVLVQTAGLVVALTALLVTGAAASGETRFDLKSIVGMGLLIAFCSAVFVKGLGLPIRLVGPWLEPLFTAIGIRV
ncbi:MAG: tripartite tricarboxylate transporter TctB family protein [Hyphomicrobium sp.]